MKRTNFMRQMVADHAKFSVRDDPHGAFGAPFDHAARLALLELFAIAAKGLKLDILVIQSGCNELQCADLSANNLAWRRIGVEN